MLAPSPTPDGHGNGASLSVVGPTGAAGHGAAPALHVSLTNRSGSPRGAAPADGTIACGSRSELHLRLLGQAPGLVRLEVDPAQLFPTECEDVVRRIRRLVPQAHVRLEAAFATPDLAQRAQDVGVQLWVDGRPWRPEPSDPVGDEHEWELWLEDTFGLKAVPDTERYLAMLAGGAPRAVHADELVAAGIVSTRAAGVRVLRSTSKALVREEAAHGGAVSQAALRALGALATVRPLRWRPVHPAATTLAAEQLRRAPSLAVAAGLTPHEAGILIELARWIALANGRSDATVGAPPSGAADETRRWAAGRMALTRPLRGRTIDEVAAKLLAIAHHASHAVASACDEALRAPTARCASALHALAHGPSASPASLRPLADELVSAGPGRTEIDDVWRIASGLVPERQRRVVTAIDAWLVSCAPTRSELQSSGGGRPGDDA